jgi:cobalamin biosynthesis protein CobC
MVPLGGAEEPLFHGGDLAAARRLFPDARQPFIDLSTGINPKPYPAPRALAKLLAALPDFESLAALKTAAANTYGAPNADHVVAAPGTQILLPMVAALARQGRAAIWSPTYSEHARAAAIAGHGVRETGNFGALADAELAMLTNPNNPDGRVFAKRDLIALAERLARRGGTLVVDEAFMDVGPPDESLAGEVGHGNIVVLRSFGKFFGLGGLRLGFAIASPQGAARLAAQLGPWAVSAPALAIGAKALSDRAWIDKTRHALARAADRLDAMLVSAGLEIIGGTSLFRLTSTHAARSLFDHLGRAGILVRRFPDHPDWLRFGLPAGAQAWRRLEMAMACWRDKG